VPDSEYCPFKADMYAAGVVLFRLIFKSYPLSSIEMKKQMVENQGKERIELKFPHNDVE
jgi:hypothetical protein